MAILTRLDEVHVSARRGLEHVLRLGGRCHQRLLAQDVRRSCANAGGNLLCVEVRPRAQNGAVQIRMAEQGLDVGEGSLAAPTLHPGLSATHLYVACRHDV